MALVITTQTTEQTLRFIEAYKARNMPLSDAQGFTSDLLEEAIIDIEANPLQYPVDPDALLRGVTIRRWLDQSGKYLCLFRYFASRDEAVLDLFVSIRQDWMSLLYLVQISRP